MAAWKARGFFVEDSAMLDEGSQVGSSTITLSQRNGRYPKVPYGCITVSTSAIRFKMRSQIHSLSGPCNFRPLWHMDL